MQRVAKLTASGLFMQATEGPLRRSPLLGDLGVPEIRLLLQDARFVRFGRGDALRLAGTTAVECLLLASGHVKEHRAMASGNEVIVAFRGPGDLVGELSVLNGAPMYCDVTALSSGEAIAISASRLHELQREVPAIERALLGAVVDRASTGDRTVTRTGHGDACERVLLALEELTTEWGVPTPVGVRISVPLTQAELAAWSGASRETVAKVFQRLRNEGVLVTSRRRLIVTEPEALTMLSHDDRVRPLAPVYADAV